MDSLFGKYFFGYLWIGYLKIKSGYTKREEKNTNVATEHERLTEQKRPAFPAHHRRAHSPRKPCLCTQ